MRGIPTYTQNSVAWPSLPQRKGIEEEISISFDARGGGTHGGFIFRWYTLDGRREYGYLRVDCFTDGLGALLDERMLRVLRTLRRLRRTDSDVIPDKLVYILEAVGIGPSAYHARGLLEQDLSPNKRLLLQDRLAKLHKHEEDAS